MFAASSVRGHWEGWRAKAGGVGGGEGLGKNLHVKKQKKKSGQKQTLIYFLRFIVCNSRIKPV